MVLGDPAFRVYLYDDDDLSSSFVQFSLEFSSFSLSEFICISDSLFLSVKFLLCLCLIPVSPLRVSHVLYLCPLSCLCLFPLCVMLVLPSVHVCLALSIFLLYHVSFPCVLLSSHVKLCVLVCVSVGFLSYFDSPWLICLCLVLLPLALCLIVPAVFPSRLYCTNHLSVYIVSVLLCLLAEHQFTSPHIHSGFSQSSFG